MRRFLAPLFVFLAASTLACEGDVFSPASAGGAAGSAGSGPSGGSGGQAGGWGGQAGAAAGGTSGKAGMGGNPLMPRSCAVRYVSPTGAFTNSGCEPSEPLPSIAMALNRATADPLGAEIRVCSGDYAEPALVFEKPLAVFGSLSCTSFAPRTSETIAEAEWSIVRSLPASKDGATVVLAESLGQTLSFDGFRVFGRESSQAASIAVQVSATGTVQITSSELLAGAGQGGQFPSVGLFATKGDLVLSRSVVKAGGGRTDGKTKGFPAVGMYVANAVEAKIERSSIRGGAGIALVKTEPVSIALLVQDSVPGTTRSLAIVGSTIDAGAAVCSFADGCESLGLRIGGGVETTIDETTIRGASLTGPATTNDFPNRVAVALEAGQGSLRLRRARVYAGDLTVGTTVGLRLFEEAVTIENTILHGGGLDGSTTATRALVQTGGSLTLRNSTVLAGRRATGSTAPSIGVALSAVASPKILDDILFTEGPKDRAITLETCASSTLPTIIGNVLVPAAAPSPFVGGACFTGEVPNLEELTKRLGESQANENRRVVSVASSKSDFPLAACTSAACALAFFESWSTPTSGRDNVLGPQLALPPRVLTCPAVKSTRPGPPLDLQGNVRPAGKLVAGATHIDCP